ncbi:MAG: hypothetical protein ACOYI9_01280 [Candidatus Hydrogenedentales bacterium]|jgi:hypothetical protein
MINSKTRVLQITMAMPIVPLCLLCSVEEAAKFDGLSKESHKRNSHSTKWYTPLSIAKQEGTKSFSAEASPRYLFTPQPQLPHGVSRHMLEYGW